MSWFDEYRNKLTTPEEAVRVVKSGDWVDYTVTNGFPALLDEALAKRKDELFDVKIRGNLIFHPLKVVECDPQREHFIYNTCLNGCRYCYANYSKSTVIEKSSRYDPYSPILCDGIYPDDRISERKVFSLAEKQISLF